MSIQPISTGVVPSATSFSTGMPDARSVKADPAPAARLKSEELLLPRGIAGVFDLTFDIYRNHFRPLFALSALVLLPLHSLLYLLFNVWLKPLNAYTDAHPDDISAAFGLITGGALTGYPQAGVPGLFSLLAFAILSAPVAVAVADIYRGVPPRRADCLRRAFRHLPRVIGGWTTMFLALIAVVAITLIIVSICAGILGSIFLRVVPTFVSVLLVALLVGIPYVGGMTTFAFGFLFTTPLIMLEDSAISAIPGRNWQLVKSPHARRTLAAIVFLPIVFLTVQALVLLSFSGLIALASLPPLLAFVLKSGSSALIITFLQPYILLFINVLYFDARMQRDGMDISLLAQNLPLVLQPNIFIPVPMQPFVTPSFPVTPDLASSSAPPPAAPSLENASASSVAASLPPMDFSSLEENP